MSDEIVVPRSIEKEEPISIKDKIEEAPVAGKQNAVAEETPTPDAQGEKKIKQDINGRISAASYSNLSSYSGDSHRMQYTFSMQANHIGDSKLSIENYITFRHTIGEWNEVQENLGNALKIYSLDAKYDFNPTTNLVFGRKINSKISSMGAIDGLQFEKGMGRFLVGALAGSRPDYADYGINPDLLQFGAYVGLVSADKEKFQQSTLAFVEQKNNGQTDRRFIYFQHSDALMKNLNIFVSAELDLYKKINNEIQNTASLTNIYFSLRYKLSKKINISASYDNRKNIIYYESYKNFIDQLIDDETRQGLRFNINYRPLKKLTVGANASWRFQKSGANDAKNLNAYLTYSRIPGLNASATLSANLLQTGYLDSKIFGLKIAKDIIAGKFNGEIYYRYVDYQYKNYEFSVNQHIAGLSFAVNITRKLGFYILLRGVLSIIRIAPLTG
ncbi:MAG: hypothetical protein IPN33_00910 [Saprospiraceae bacterium]|nr:hypothetical protein [Saprospiraceae bacterium]